MDQDTVSNISTIRFTQRQILMKSLANHVSLVTGWPLCRHCEISWHFPDSLRHSSPCCGYSYHAQPRDSIVSWCQKFCQNSNGITPNGGVKCRWGWLNAGVVAEMWRLSMWSVVNLVRSQVYHIECPPDMFAANSPQCSVSRGFVSDSWSLLRLWCGLTRVVLEKRLLNGCLFVNKQQHP